MTYAVHLTRNQYGYHFLSYLCRNCTTFSKRFAVAVKLEETGSGGDILKIGELPPFGPPVPSKVINLIGPNRELFLMGRRAENQGMGIGAFSYYRRVIESQKNRIFDEIIKVLRNISGSDEIIKAITTAKAETQFTRAVDSVKYALPESLLIKGHNPLTLLYSALSKGLHAKTDEECLELATSIRVVLSELAERIGQLLKDEKELNEAVSRLLKPES